MLNGLVFVDTNVWVARVIEDHAFHQRALAKLNELAAQGELFCFSSQIIREFMAVCTLGRGLSRTLTWEEIQPQIEALLTQTILLYESEASIRKLIELGKFHSVRGKQIHDTNIAATMLTNGISRLLTFNPDDFKRFTEIEIIVP